MENLAFASACTLASLLAEKKISSVELVGLYAKRIAQHNGTINAIIWKDLDAAYEQARLSDQRRAEGKTLSIFDGVPCTVKESFQVSGWPTTWGVPDQKNNVTSTTSDLVSRYLGAGLILMGKTNVPLLLSDWQTFNDIYGTTSNPWGHGLIPGGSSGGSAAALAAGLTGLEAGSDIGASIRNPAHYCGVYGHKPTFGVVSPRGQSLGADLAMTDIAVVGPMARSAEDLIHAFSIVAGPPDDIAAGWTLSLPKPSPKPLSDYRVAIIDNSTVSEVDDQVREKLQELGNWLELQGTKVHRDLRPAFSDEEAMDVYLWLLRGATSKRMSDAFVDSIEEQLAVLPSHYDYQRRALEAQRMSHRHWLRWDEKRLQLGKLWAEFFKDFDLLLCPAAASTAYQHDQENERFARVIQVNGKDVPTTDQLFWAGHSCVAYLPATVAPIGLARNGLPVGVQIVGPKFGDYACMQFAALLEKYYGGFQIPPNMTT
ncbi:MAG: amidase [Alphaproteobacteria bacterium]